MGTNNRARRAAKAKQRAKHRGEREAVFSEVQSAEIAWLTAAGVGIGQTGNPRAGLTRLAQLPRTSVLSVAEQLLREHVALLWEHGWQPRELHRQGQIGGRGNVARLVELVVVTDLGRRLAAAAELHPQWREQAEELTHHTPGLVPAGWLDRWQLDSGLPTTAEADSAYAVVAAAIAVLFTLPPVDVLIPPPGHQIVPDDRQQTTDPSIDRVRALLAKAESTQFEAEAMAFTAKAQELITKHAIDVAMLASEAKGPDAVPVMIRIPIDPPYADAKSLLLQTAAATSRCQAVFNQRISTSNVVGFPDDLTAVEILFTSLLVQAQHALGEAGRAAPSGTQPRSQGFRSAFLLAYAQRIGERLDEINAHVFSTTGTQAKTFLPVLRSQEDAIADFVSERFGDLVRSSVRSGYSPSGWSSGRLAADQARLAAGHLDPPVDEQLF